MHTKLWFVCGVVLIAGFASIATPKLAAAQAGSTGGTIGKTNKSVSGGDTTKQTVTSRGQLSSGRGGNQGGACRKMVGTWNWDGGDAVFDPDGSARFSGIMTHTANWRCSEGLVIVVWSNGITDRITVAPDGNSVSVTNSYGKTFVGTRK
jgi:hypothetical protein